MKKHIKFSLVGVTAALVACLQVEDGGINAASITCDDVACRLVLNATLEDLKGKPVQEGLSVDDFKVSDLRFTADSTAVEPQSWEVVDLIYDETDADHVSLAMIIDQSGSMEDNDPDGQRFVAARELTQALFEDSTEAHQVALMSFPLSGNAPTSLEDTDIWQDFTSSSEAILTGISAMEAEGPDGGTPLYASIAETCYLMDDRRASLDGILSMVVMTDGKDSNDMEEALNAALASGIRLYMVGLGTSVDDEDLNLLASATGGVYIPADDENLSQIFADLAGALYGSVNLEIAVTFNSAEESLEPGNSYAVTGDVTYKNDLHMPLNTTVWVAEATP